MRLFRRRHYRAGRKLPHRACWWHVSFFVYGVRYRRTLRTVDRTEALVMAARIMSETKTRADAGAGAVERAENNRTLNTYVQRFRAELVRRQRSTRYVRQVVIALERLFELAAARDLGDCTMSSLSAGLALVPGGARSQNFARGAAFAMFRWLERAGEWPHNPVEAITPARVVTDRIRRSLTPDEFQRLVAVAPEHRAIVYRVAAVLGLRRSTLSALEPAHYDRERRELRTPAGAKKNRKEGLYPVPDVLAFHLERWLAKVEKGPRRVGLFRVPDVRSLYADLAAAGIPVETGFGRIDFRALKVTCGSTAAALDVPQATAQRLLDHADYRTTQLYTRVGPEQIRDATERIADTLCRAPRRKRACS